MVIELLHILQAQKLTEHHISLQGGLFSWKIISTVIYFHRINAMSQLVEESWRGKKCSIQFRDGFRGGGREESSVCAASRMMVNAKLKFLLANETEEE